MFKQNVGCIDSFLRIFSGIWLTYAAIQGLVGGWGFLGIVLIITGLSRVCPPYAMMGFNSNGCKHEAKH